MFTQEMCLTNFKEQKIYRRQLQKQFFENSFLTILKYSQEISMVEIVSIKQISVIAFLKLC